MIFVPEEDGYLMYADLLFGTIFFYELLHMTAAGTTWQRLPPCPLSYQKFSFGNTGRVCKTLQTILRDKKVEFYVT